MSWHYLQEQEEVSSDHICWDGVQFALSKSRTILAGYCLHDSEMASCPGSPSGTISEPSTGDPGADVSISSRAGFPVKIFLAPVKEQESKANDPGSGQKWQELSARYDPATHSWKTHQCLFVEDLQPSSLTLPKWGMMRGGVLSERITQALPTSGTESGLWRTPKATEGNKPSYGDKSHQGLAYQVKMWPTPTASVAGPDFAKMDRSKTGISLQTAVAMDQDIARSARNGIQNHLGSGAPAHVQTVVQMFPTPKSRDWKGKSQRGEHAPMDALPNMITGSLNPDWVELLMGWPLGWTDITQPCEPVIRPWDAHWEEGVPRVTTRTKNRVARLKAIGNGQVPAVTALAWEILSNA